ncbi:Crp/Fnr family transcriptional regulator [Paracoccaceae bacterium GXU_MW_L88]
MANYGMVVSKEHLTALTDDPLVINLFAGQTPRRYAAHHVLFRMEERAEYVFLLISGQVEISYLSPNGQRMIANFVPPGGLIGEIAVLDGGRRTATAICTTECELMVLSRRAVIAALEQDGLLATAMIQRLCARLREMHQSMAGHTMLNLRARLATRLIQLSEQTEDREGWVRISQSGLAEYTSATRESVNKIMGEYRQEGFIETRRGAYRVRNEAGLRDMAEDALHAY